MVEIALVPEDIERLQEGETVNVTIPGLETPGRNTTVSIHGEEEVTSRVYGMGHSDALQINYDHDEREVTGYEYTCVYDDPDAVPFTTCERCGAGPLNDSCEKEHH